MSAPVFARHVVVDGSNIATEGRSMPSLAQLDEAVREYRREFPDDIVVVVVDATFGHRIEDPERAVFDEAVAHNEIVSPPAGAIGRGDAFLLRIAEKVGATVLSNDSFQEFHGEYEWLFNNGRLIGGKPVPGVGWIFTPRTPVRGPRSREATKVAKRGVRRPRPEQEQQKVRKAIAVATEEAVEPDSPSAKRRRRRRGSPPPAEPVNEPLAFIELVAAHPLGSKIEGEVETFSSHGAFIQAGGARCYIPLSALADPAPRAAKDVLRKGETRTFVIQALDPARRGIELALPEFARVSGEPRPETVEDEINEGAVALHGGRSRRRSRPATDEGSGALGDQVPTPAPAPAQEPVAVAVSLGDRAVDERAPARAARQRAAAKAALEDQPVAHPEVTATRRPAVKRATTAEPASADAPASPTKTVKKAASATKTAASTAAKKAASTTAKKAASAKKKPASGTLAASATIEKPTGPTAEKAAAAKQKAPRATAKAAGSVKKATRKAVAASTKATTPVKKATGARKNPAKKAAADSE